MNDCWLMFFWIIPRRMGEDHVVNGEPKDQSSVVGAELHQVPSSPKGYGLDKYVW